MSSRPLRILVLLKHALDPATVDADPLTGELQAGRALSLADPAGEQALLWALEAGAEVAVLVAGPEAAEATARHALALGADAVYRAECASPDEPLPAAHALASAAAALGPFDLVLAGDRSVDRGTGLVPPAVAAYLGLPFAGEAALPAPAAMNVSRERLALERLGVRGSRIATSVPLPAVVAVRDAHAPALYASFDGHVRALRASIPVAPQAAVAGRPGETAVVGVAPFRLPPRSVAGPDARDDAPARIRSILAADASRGSGRVVEGDVRELVEATTDYLRETGFLGGAGE